MSESLTAQFFTFSQNADEGTGKSCINKDPKSSLEKPDFSYLNNEHKISKPQPLFFIYSLVIHTHPSPHEILFHHITASRLLFSQHYHIIVLRLFYS